MNNQIKYLAIKAGLDIDGFGYPIWGSLESEDAKKEFLEKFAELIIKDQQREWVGLTDDEVNEIYASGDAYRIRIVRLIEAKLKEKNNAT